MPKKGKTIENNLEKNETEPQQNNSETGVKNPSNKTINGTQRESEQNTEVTQEVKIRRHKEGLRKKTFKEGIGKGKRLTFKEMKELAVKKRLQRQFRGAKKEPLNNLSAARLASYGLAKKKKKKS